MDFAKGDRVRFLGRPDWGPGKVLQNSSNGKVHVAFESAGEKLLLLQYAKIFKVSRKNYLQQQRQESFCKPRGTAPF